MKINLEIELDNVIQYLNDFICCDDTLKRSVEKAINDLGNS